MKKAGAYAPAFPFGELPMIRRFQSRKPTFPTINPQASYRFGGTDIFLFFVVDTWQIWKVENRAQIFCGTDRYRSKATEIFFAEIRKLLI